MIDYYDYTLRELNILVDWLNRVLKEESPSLSHLNKIFQLPEGAEIKVLRKELEIRLLTFLCRLVPNGKYLIFSRWYKCLVKYNKEHNNKYKIILKRDEKIELPRAAPLERVSTALRLLTDEEYKEVKGQIYLLLSRLFSKGENDALEHDMDNQYPPPLPNHWDVYKMGHVFDKDVT